MKNLLTSLRFAVASIAVCCVVYPAVLLAFGQLCAPWRANGSMITDDNGRIIGSELIAQKFTRPEYFWSRPSAVDYNAGAAGGSNLSPTNPKLSARARATIAKYRLTDGQSVPADLVAASGSGLDPHITVDAVYFQLERVATARPGLSLSTMEGLIAQNMEASTLRVFGGKSVVNVLKLNVAFDKAAAQSRQ